MELLASISGNSILPEFVSTYLKPLMLLILHRTKWTWFSLWLKGFIGPSSVTWSFDTECGIGEANSNEKPHWKKKIKNQEQGEIEGMFESSWTVQGWKNKEKGPCPLKPIDSWCSVHITFINFVKPRTKNCRLDQKPLHLGDESCEVYHPNMEQNL